MKNTHRNDERKPSKAALQAKKRRRWVALVSIGTFFTTVLFTYVSDLLLSDTGLLVSFILLFVIIGIGICTDILGIAVASVSIEPFNAMASRKMKGAKTAVVLVRNAARVSSVCNDVIGDICGIVSGATSVSIVAQLLIHFPLWNATVTSLLASGAVACLTVGGKAMGKDFAMRNGKKIVMRIATVIASMKLLFRGRE